MSSLKSIYYYWHDHVKIILWTLIGLALLSSFIWGVVGGKMTMANNQLVSSKQDLKSAKATIRHNDSLIKTVKQNQAKFNPTIRLKTQQWVQTLVKTKKLRNAPGLTNQRYQVAKKLFAIRGGNLKNTTLMTMDAPTGKYQITIGTARGASIPVMVVQPATKHQGYYQIKMMYSIQRNKFISLTEYHSVGGGVDGEK